MPLSKEAAKRKDERTGITPMQHRHFATIAVIIKDMCELYVGPERNTCFFPAEIARHFADRLAETNPRFDRERFLEACGL